MFCQILSNLNRPHSTPISSSQSALTSSCLPQLRRYASSPVILYCVYRRVNKPIPGPGNHRVHQSTISTTIRFFMSFIFFDRISASRINLDTLGGNGLPNAGGTSWRKFAEGGGTSSSGQPLTCVSPSFAQLAHPWWTCWHIRLPFPSLSITMKLFNTSPQKTKRE